ncbi:MAG: glutamate-1-semialdehyde-2,1-aminomutase [Gammaproteobacteria bacterium]|nr:glutamate-1-semialdehyde-2,1-aminomutase [Gammaproteobacteria bacterium]MYF01667.1 glutamate-1-semialdehyde-2,1-aminomutase [Gammaproteobacteria bacterium]MYI78105.1 glutamate-1-semialdehyde-2,1-aminomutase [Gammaproteobacteria bacterium]
MHKRSADAYQRALQLIPGGVNSPVRAFKGVGGTPVFFESGQGPFLFDLDGNKYVDYVASWGPMLQGYSFPPVVHAVTTQAQRATSFGAPCLLELELANLLVSCVPSLEKVRMVNSGTEATMSVVRLARGITNRDRIVKFTGCFHGHADSLLVQAGSGVLTLGLPDSPGVPTALAQQTLSLPYNNVEAVRDAFTQFGTEIAAVIVEPIAGNMGCIPPVSGFLEELRTQTTRHGSLLIFDEVMTGFRVARGGAQEMFKVTPDLTTLGKVVGGGLPVGAFGGSVELMDQLAPVGPIYQSGTLSGNPLAMAGGLALLDSLEIDFHEKLEARTSYFTEGIRDLAIKHNVDLCINSVCGMFSFYFTTQSSVSNYHHVERCDSERYAQFFHEMLRRGIYFAPSAYECAFVSGSHTTTEIDQTLVAFDEVFGQL